MLLNRYLARLMRFEVVLCMVRTMCVSVLRTEAAESRMQARGCLYNDRSSIITNEHARSYAQNVIIKYVAF